MDIKSLFPLEGEVTQDIIDKADISNPRNCIGALTLKAALASKGVSSITGWINTFGVLGDKEETTSPFTHVTVIHVTTIGGIPMMDVKTPQKVTFIISKT